MNLTVDQIKILLNGLTSLEGALGALGQPLPEEISELKNALKRQEQATERSLTLETSGHLTTRQVADRLGYSPPWVRHLAKKNSIHLVRRGKRGRGRSSMYDANSVETYLKNHVTPKDSKETNHENSG